MYLYLRPCKQKSVSGDIFWRLSFIERPELVVRRLAFMILGGSASRHPRLRAILAFGAWDHVRRLACPIPSFRAAFFGESARTTVSDPGAHFLLEMRISRNTVQLALKRYEPHRAYVPYGTAKMKILGPPEQPRSSKRP